MATKFRVYDGEQIVFYSTDLTKSATLFLNAFDQLEVGILAGHADVANAGIKTPSIELLTSITGAGSWSAAIISAAKGGTGIGTYVVGDILYADTTSTLARLAKGANGQFLTMAAGALTWSNTIATGGLSITGDLTVTGNMTVNGTTTTVNTTTLAVSDNIIILNQDVTGVPSENAGIEIERGTSTNSTIRWNETSDAWEMDKAGAAGTIEQIVSLTSSQLLTNKTFSSSATASGLSLTPLTTGFSIAGGLTTSKTLTATATLTLTGTDNSQLSLAGNLTTSGAYALTLTQTGATNVTLPTTGTLTTLAGAETFTNKAGYNGLVVTANTGVITTGTWNATAIITSYGGTGLTTFTAGDMLYYTAGTVLSKLAIGTNKYVLQSNGSAPVWQANLDIGTNTITSGDITTSGNIAQAINKATGTSNFASGFDGYGWRLNTSAKGTATVANIASLSYANSQVTITTSVAHGIVPGQSVTVAGVTVSSGSTLVNTNSPYKILRVPTTTTLVIGITETGSPVYNTSVGTVTPNLAYTSNLEVDNLVVRGVMSVYELLIQQVKATNGSIIITAAETIDSVTTPTVGSEVIVFEDPSGHGVVPFVVNDIIWCKRVDLNSSTTNIIKQVVRKISAISGLSVTLTNVGIGTPPADMGILEAGDVLVRIGNTTDTTRQGSIYLTADDTNAPYININDGVASWDNWVDSSFAGSKLKVRLGNLKGITDTAVGLNNITTYGLYAQSAYLRGNLVVGGVTNAITLAANTVSIGNITGTANSAIKIANTATASTSGIFGYNSAGAEVFKLALDSTASIAGWSFDATKISNTNISISSATLAAASGDIILSGGDAKVYVGSGVTLDGTTTGSVKVGTTVLLDGASTGKLAIGTTASSISMTVGTGIYADGGGNFKAGTAATHGIFWDGTTFKVKANSLDIITAIAGSATIAGWTATNTQLYNTNIMFSTTTVAAASGDIILSGGDAKVYVGSGVTLDGTTTGSVKVGTTVLLDGASTGKLAIGTTASSISMTVGTGIYADGGGNFKAGTAATHGIFWDGTTFKVKANSLDIITAIAGSATIAGWYANTASLWSGNSVAGSGNIILTQSNMAINAKIAIGTSADSITVAGAQIGSVIYGNGTFKFMAGTNDFIRSTSSQLELSSSNFMLKSGIWATPSMLLTTTTFALGTNNAHLQTLVYSGAGVYMNSTGHFKAGTDVKYMKWDGSDFLFKGTNNQLTSTTLTTTNASIGSWTIGATTIASTGITLTHSATAASASVRLGSATAFGTGIGTWMDGAGNFRVGDPAGSYAQFTGSAFSVAGTIYATAGSFGGTIAAPHISISDYGLTIQDSGSTKRVYINNGNTFRPPSTNASVIIGGDSVFVYPYVPGSWTFTGTAAVSTGYVTTALCLITTGDTAYYTTGTLTAGTMYTFQLDANMYNYYGGFTINLYKSVNGTDFTGAVVTTWTVAAGSNTDYLTKKYSYYNANTDKIKLEIVAGTIQATHPLKIQNVTFTPYDYFSELNPQGLYVYASPTDYIKIGKTGIDLMSNSVIFSQLTVSDNLTVLGNLTVAGDQTIVGATTVANPLQILNSGATLTSGYAGLEVDNSTTGTGPVFLYDVTDTRWKFGVRASGNTGAQTAFTLTGVGSTFYGNILTDTSTDTLINKTWQGAIIASTYGGTGNGFTKFSGPTTAEKTFTLPDVSATLLYSGGALGTPSSGIVTNLTGTASININGTVGATTANTGIFTTVTANTGIVPDANDGAYLGTTALGFSDLFLATGGVINWANGEVTLTGGGNLLTLAGGDLALAANNITMTGSIAATGARVTKGWFTDLESTNALTISGVKVNDVIRIEEALSTGGLVQNTAHQVPGGLAYNAWVGSGVGTTFQTTRTMQVFIDGRLQRPGGSYDYVECDNLGTAVAQYASATYIKFNYDLAEGTNITYIIQAV